MSEIKVSGHPPDDERHALLTAIEEMLETERSQRQMNPWVASGRAANIRGGALEARHQLMDTTWGWSDRMGLGGQEPPSLKGRGEAK